MHAWSIPEHEYARHESRRGRRHAYVELEPARTALVVIDMVPFFVDENPVCLGIVPNINALGRALRTGGGVVAWVLPGAVEPSPVREEFYGPEVAAAYAGSGGEGPLGERLWPGLAVESGDILVEKTAPSAFFPGRCGLPDLLGRTDVDTVLIAGTVTNVCCESSARDACTLGFRVILLADATAAVSDEQQNASLRTVYRSFGDVRSTADVIGLLGSGRVPGSPGTER